MIPRDFLAALAANPDAPLHFDPGAEAGGPVAPGYHVTEFKATSVHAVACKERDRTVGRLPRLEPAATGVCCAPEPIVVGAVGRTEGASCCG